jgi:hypothetical protein
MVFQPPKYLFNAFALLLADFVAGVPRGALIDRIRTRRDVLGHVRGHLQQPDGLHEIPRSYALSAPTSRPRPAGSG